MKCRKCKGPTKVLKSWTLDTRVTRRRECLKCQHRFNTHELCPVGLVYLDEEIKKSTKSGNLRLVVNSA